MACEWSTSLRCRLFCLSLGQGHLHLLSSVSYLCYTFTYTLCSQAVPTHGAPTPHTRTPRGEVPPINPSRLTHDTARLGAYQSPSPLSLTFPGLRPREKDISSVSFPGDKDHVRVVTLPDGP